MGFLADKAKGKAKEVASKKRDDAAAKVGLKNKCDCGCGRPCRAQFATLACSLKEAGRYS